MILRLRVWAVIVVLAAAGLTACGGSESPTSDAGTLGTTSPSQSTAPSATQTTETLPGGPAPAELQGMWLLISDTSEGPNRLYITERRYTVSAGASHQGDLVVNGNEIAFFNSFACGFTLPEGVGRYRWRVEGKRLHLDPIGKEPCSGRATFLADATYERTG
jgi:hypothetical protein